MYGRWLASAATAWTLGYLAVYVALVRSDGNAPVWWYIGLLAIGMVPLIAAVAGRASRPALVAGAVALALAALLGLLSIGILLLPAAAGVIVAAVRMKPTSPAASESR
jgi:hypothetical protein